MEEVLANPQPILSVQLAPGWPRPTDLVHDTLAHIRFGAQRYFSSRRLCSKVASVYIFLFVVFLSYIYNSVPWKSKDESVWAGGQ